MTAPSVPCPYCGTAFYGAWRARGYVYHGLTSHKTRCATATAEARATYRQTGRWPMTARERRSRQARRRARRAVHRPATPARTSRPRMFVWGG